MEFNSQQAQTESHFQYELLAFMIWHLIIEHNKVVFNLVDVDLIIVFGSTFCRSKSIFAFHTMIDYHVQQTLCKYFSNESTKNWQNYFFDWMLTGYKLNFSILIIIHHDNTLSNKQAELK